MEIREVLVVAPVSATRPSRPTRWHPKYLVGGDVTDVPQRTFRKLRPLRGPISLLLIDVDNFKAFNDTCGHQADDTALTSIAECISGGAQRASDLVARYGGEEFAVLLTGETLKGAVQVAEGIRASVLSLRTQQQDRPDIAPTISIGVACVIPQAGLAPHDLIKSADVALYEAKRQGRDRTVAAPKAEKTRDRLAA